jgi:heat-inducible transcriptional repressor
MDDRKATVLRAVVESFIDTAQPVGSRAVADLAGLDVSAATIRNDMAALEAEGYLSQPHTSAGRIPTEAGYRYFVDALGPGRLDVTETRQVRAFFEHAQGQIEQRLVDTSRLLSQLTTYAAVVVGPPHDLTTVRSAQLVDLGGGRILLVVVTSSGSVERSMLELDADPEPDDATISQASSVLNASLVGGSVGGSHTIDPTGDPAVDRLVSAAVEAIGTRELAPGDLYVGGAANMAAQFDAITTVRSVLAVLEEQLLVVSLLGNLVDRGLSVAIGSETGLEPLSECAVVVAPYAVDGEPVGSIGLLGPTRMDYPRALAAVQVVSSRLGESLGETSEE